MEKVYALHAVHVNKKHHNLDEARHIAQDIIKNSKKKFVKETNHAYKFRNHAKQKFLPKSLERKKISKSTTLVYGQLRPEHHHLRGEGFFDYFKKKANDAKQYVRDKVQDVKNFFSPRLDDYNNKSKKTIKDYGNLPIKSMQIYRTPIASFIEPVLNAVSLGKWNQLKSKYSFDKMFHLALVCNVGSKNVMCQKLSTVDITTEYKTNSNTEVHQVNMEGKQFTVYEMLEKARQQQGDRKFFEYDAFSNNCQYFISYLLGAEGLYSEDSKQFLFQDISGIVKELPDYVKRFARGVTDLDATVNKVTGGKKKRAMSAEEKLKKKEYDRKRYLKKKCKI